jgi:cyclopropane-fatty-acyl-phospholipid synthase
MEGPASPQVPSFTLVLRRPGALRRMLWPPSELALAEAYLQDDFDIEGDIETATGLIDTLSGRLRSPAVLARLVAHLRALPPDDLPESASGPQPRLLRPRGRRRSRQRDAAAVRAHYDVGNDFYALWLDRRTVYSCAYFSTGEEDIDAAQTAKLEYLCRKLRLKPGERLLDIGCGWGGLVQYMAASARAFATGKIGVIQVLFSKPDQQGASSLPLTRGDLYLEPRDVVDTGGMV